MCLCAAIGFPCEFRNRRSSPLASASPLQLSPKHLMRWNAADPGLTWAASEAESQIAYHLVGIEIAAVRRESGQCRVFRRAAMEIAIPYVKRDRFCPRVEGCFDCRNVGAELIADHAAPEGRVQPPTPPKSFRAYGSHLTSRRKISQEAGVEEIEHASLRNPVTLPVSECSRFQAPPT
jgi:hypothetical protein